MYHTTKLSPSVFLPVSLRYTTMRGHTPTMLLTTSTRDGIDSSPVMMARRRLVRDIIQSRCSTPFSHVTMNSVIEKGSKDPKTEDDTFCKHRFRRRRSKMGYSTNLCKYPLPKYSLYVSASTCDPPETATRDAELPTAATTDPVAQLHILCSINCEAVDNIHSNPTESALLPRPHESPQRLATLLELKAIKMMNLCPPNNSWQNSGQHSSIDNWLKAKQQRDSGMRRIGSGNLRNLPKLRLVSRQLHASLARRLAQTAPTVSRWDRSCLPSSTHLPGRTHSLGLATEGRSHQLRQRSSPLQTDSHDPVIQEDPSESSPSAAPAHLQSRDFLENPARATQVFQDANDGHEQSDDAPENAATLHGAHVWARTHSFGTTDIKSGWAYWQHLMALSQRTCQALLPRIPSSSGKFSCFLRQKFPAPLTCICLVSAGVRRLNSLRTLWVSLL